MMVSSSPKLGSILDSASNSVSSKTLRCITMPSSDGNKPLPWPVSKNRAFARQTHTSLIVVKRCGARVLQGSGGRVFWVSRTTTSYTLFGPSRLSSLITLSTSLMTSSVRISPSITTRSRRANTCPTTIAQSAMICTKLALKFEHTKTSQLPTQLTRLTRTVPPMI
jgi:hypothetical protein